MDHDLQKPSARRIRTESHGKPPVGEELFQFFHLLAAGGGVLPAQVLGDLAQVVRAGMGPPPVAPQRPRGQIQRFGQPGHRHRRSRRHIVGHEPEPGQRRELDGDPEPIGRASSPPRIHE
jgi:hypothetical protein